MFCKVRKMDKEVSQGKAKKPKKKNKERKPKIAPKPTKKAKIDRDESDPDLTDSDEFMGMHTGL